MTDVLEKQFHTALRLKDEGKLDDALHHFKQLARQYPDAAPVYGVMGNILWDLDNLKEAIICFKTVVTLSPRSELGSLGLFHTLWETGQREEALQEIERFLSMADSEEYRALLRKMNDESDKDSG